MSTGAAVDLPNSALRPVAAGVVVGVDHVGHAAALATLLFAGPLLGGAIGATALFVASGLLPTLALALDRRLPAPIYANIQHAPIAVLAPMAVIAAQNEAVETGVPTMAAIIGLTALAVGAALVVTAAFNLARIVRLMPYPVSSGFLAASGALLALSALQALLPDSLPDLGTGVSQYSAELVAPVMAVALAGALWVATRAAPSLGLIATLAASVFCSNIIIVVAETPPETAHALGLLRAGSETEAFAQTGFISILDWSAVDWTLVQSAGPLIGAATFIALLGAVLNLAGVELALQRDVAVRRVLLHTGLSNLALGGAGGSAAYVSLSTSTVGLTLGGRSRVSALTVCAVVGLGLAFTPTAVAILPPFVTSGLLIFIGLTILNRWFLAQFWVTSRSDWLLTGLIVLVAVAFGIVPAIALGIVAASLIFAVNYAQLPVIRASSDLSRRRSRVDRGPSQTAFLNRNGSEVAIVTLQGYLFFGSVDQLSDYTAALFDAAPNVRSVIFDFRRVRRIDAAAATALKKIDSVARARGGRLVLAAMSDSVSQTMRATRARGDATILTEAATADAALEAAEEELLARMDAPEALETAESAIARIIGRPELSAALLSRMERVEVPRRKMIIEMGAESEDVFLIDSGRLAVTAPGPDGATIRLRSMIAGALVGEVASYASIPRTANVVAETDAVVYRARPSVLAAITEDAPELAVAWHKMIAVALADKLHRTNKLIEEE